MSANYATQTLKNYALYSPGMAGLGLIKQLQQQQMITAGSNIRDVQCRKTTPDIFEVLRSNTTLQEESDLKS